MTTDKWMGNIVLKVSQLVHQYGEESFLFNFCAKEGDIVALMGPSGVGKSTLLALIGGFITPSSGRIEVNGESLLNLEPHQRPFSMLFQEHNLFSHLTVRDNIGLGLHPGLRLNKQQMQLVEEAAIQVGVGDYLDRTPHKLSGGQRQRVALARCLVQSRPIWLLDEPFSSLDPVLREEMLTLVKKLVKKRNITLIMVTHHVSDAQSIATHFVFFAESNVQIQGKMAQFSAQHDNERLREFALFG